MSIDSSQTASPPANNNGQEPCGAVLVCGGGVAGIQASLDLSAAGFRVYLVEESPTIGGGMARLDKTFPTGDCATCIISPKLVECIRDLNIDESPQPFVPGEQLPPEEARWLDDLLARYADDPAPLIPLLQDINDDRGYLPRAMLERLAVCLEIPLAEILRVASFYNALSLEPVGRHVIEVCLGTACFVRGSGTLLERLEQQTGVAAGGTDEAMRFTLRTVRCIGCCALAPAMRIDGVTFGKVKLDKVPDILEQFA